MAPPLQPTFAFLERRGKGATFRILVWRPHVCAFCLTYCVSVLVHSSVVRKHRQKNDALRSTTTYILDTFLKASGCRSWILSPLSHRIRARLASLNACIWAENEALCMYWIRRTYILFHLVGHLGTCFIFEARLCKRKPIMQPSTPPTITI